MLVFSAEDLFKQAKTLLNTTRANKFVAYKLLAAAATLGHREARSMLAWAQLLGTHITSLTSRTSSQDIPAAVQTFVELVEFGLPSAHMVKFICSFGTTIIAVNTCRRK